MNGTDERLARLEERTEHLIGKVDDIKDNHLNSIYGKIDSINRRLNGRPSWTVCTIIAFLSSGFITSVALLIRSIING